MWLDHTKDQDDRLEDEHRRKRLCLSRAPWWGYCCSLPDGHTGEHVARKRDKAVLMRWNDKGEVL